MKNSPTKYAIVTLDNGMKCLHINGKLLLSTDQVAEMAFHFYQSHGLPCDVLLDYIETLPNLRVFSPIKEAK